MPEITSTYDGVIVGAGVVGLTIALELSRRGLRVVVLDRQQPGREASWAGAGLMPPGSWYSDAAWAEWMAQASHELYPQLVGELREATGVDCELVQCGGSYLVEPTATRELCAKFERWRSQGIAVSQIDKSQLAKIEPRLILPPEHRDSSLWHVPAELQVRNPRLLQALHAGVTAQGSQVVPDREVRELDISEGQCVGVETSAGLISAGFVCVAGGSWSGRLLNGLAPRARVKPIRGQMLLLKEKTPSLMGNVHLVAGENSVAGSAYVVPRRDGHSLIGSTVEDVGFDKSTTESAQNRFRGHARSLTSGLALADEVTAWSGLRPASHDEAPYIGPVPSVTGLFVATGHYRTGLQFAPPTALLLSSMVLGTAPPIDPNPFRLDR